MQSLLEILAIISWRFLMVLISFTNKEKKKKYIIVCNPHECFHIRWLTFNVELPENNRHFPKSTFHFIHFHLSIFVWHKIHFDMRVLATKTSNTSLLPGATGTMNKLSFFVIFTCQGLYMCPLTQNLLVLNLFIDLFVVVVSSAHVKSLFSLPTIDFAFISFGPKPKQEIFSLFGII